MQTFAYIRNHAALLQQNEEKSMSYRGANLVSPRGYRPHIPSGTAKPDPQVWPHTKSGQQLNHPAETAKTLSSTSQTDHACG